MTEITQREKQIVLSVFSDLLRKSFAELNTFIGSETIKDMAEMYHRLSFDDYCRAHNVRYEDMTEGDFIAAYEEKYQD